MQSLIALEGLPLVIWGPILPVAPTRVFRREGRRKIAKWGILRYAMSATLPSLARRGGAFKKFHSAEIFTCQVANFPVLEVYSIDYLALSCQGRRQKSIQLNVEGTEAMND